MWFCLLFMRSAAFTLSCIIVAFGVTVGRVMSQLRYCNATARNRWGEATSQDLWPRFVRHFVGITWRNVWS